METFAVRLANGMPFFCSSKEQMDRFIASGAKREQPEGHPVKRTAVEALPGEWRIAVEMPENVAIFNLDDGVLPEGTFKPYPRFATKTHAEGFIQGLEFAEAR